MYTVVLAGEGDGGWGVDLGKGVGGGLGKVVGGGGGSQSSGGGVN